MALGGISDSTFNRAVSGGLSSRQKATLDKIDDPTQRAQAEAQLELTQEQTKAQFINNILTKIAQGSEAIVRKG